MKHQVESNRTRTCSLSATITVHCLQGNPKRFLSPNRETFNHIENNLEKNSRSFLVCRSLSKNDYSADFNSKLCSNENKSNFLQLIIDLNVPDKPSEELRTIKSIHKIQEDFRYFRSSFLEKPFSIDFRIAHDQLVIIPRSTLNTSEIESELFHHIETQIDRELFAEYFYEIKSYRIDV